MLITSTKTVSDGFGGRLAFAASVYVCQLQNDGQPSSMLDRDWGGVEADPPDTNFQSPVWGHLQPVGGLTPPDKSNAAGEPSSYSYQGQLARQRNQLPVNALS